MRGMSIDALRRLAARPDWPLISGLTLAAIALFETAAYTLGVDDPEDSLAAVLNLLATVPLVWRRSRPIPVAVIISFATLWIALEPLTLTVSAVVGLGWATYSVAARSRRWVAVLLGVPFFVYAWGAQNGAAAAVLLAAVVFGFVVGNSRRLTVERDEARDEQAAMGERARIARELHDVVAHHISMIVVQADTARLATPGPRARRSCCRSARRRATRWTSCAASWACCATTPAPRSSTRRSPACTSSTSCSTPPAERGRRCG
jgi:signal transduction histidine kinase